jgi:hypothetical protein
MSANRMISLPVSALRAVFTGVGRIVMVADRAPDAPPDRAGDRAGDRRAGGDGDAASPRWRSLDLTGNVRLLSADDLDDGGVPVRQAEPEEAQASADLYGDGDPLPLASYDSLTLPSIRARLRSLDVSQLRVLAAYERTHAERPEVLGMLERRIERLEAGR